MRTITGRVRPFGSGTKPLFVRFQWPESLDEIVEVLETRYDGDVERGVLVDAAKKAMIRVQDEVRNDERWEGREAPAEENTDAWSELQSEVNEMVDARVLEVQTYPGETKSKKKDTLDEAREDPERAEQLIEELRQRHGL